MEGFIGSHTAITGIEFSHENAEQWRKDVASFNTEIGKHLCENGHSFSERVEGFKNNSELIRNFIKNGDTDEDLEKFVVGLTEEELSKLKELNRLKSTHVDVYNQVEKRYKTDEEVINDLYKLCGDLAFSHVLHNVLDSNPNTKTKKNFYTDGEYKFDLNELSMVVNGKNLFLTDDENLGDIYVEEGTTREEFKNILIELLK